MISISRGIGFLWAYLLLGRYMITVFLYTKRIHAAMQKHKSNASNDTDQ